MAGGKSTVFCAPKEREYVPLLLPPSPGTKQHPPRARPRRRPFRQHAAKRAATYLASFSPFAWPPRLCTNQAKKPARGPRFELAPTKLRTPPGVPAYSSAARICGVGFGVACGVGFEAGFRPANGAGALSLCRPRIISREAKPATGRPARERAGEARSGRRRRRC